MKKKKEINYAFACFVGIIIVWLVVFGFLFLRMTGIRFDKYNEETDECLEWEFKLYDSERDKLITETYNSCNQCDDGVVCTHDGSIITSNRCDEHCSKWQLKPFCTLCVEKGYLNSDWQLTFIDYSYKEKNNILECDERCVCDEYEERIWCREDNINCTGYCDFTNCTLTCQSYCSKIEIEQVCILAHEKVCKEVCE